MSRIITVAVGTVLWLSVVPASFAADPETTSASPPPSSQMSDDQIRNQLAIDGYTVLELTREGGRVAVIATDKQGTTSKLLVDAETGQVKPAAADEDDEDEDGDGD